MVITVIAHSGEELKEFSSRATDPKAIGKIIGLTRERVRQLEKKALADLKDAAEQVL